MTGICWGFLSPLSLSLSLLIFPSSLSLSRPALQLVIVRELRLKKQNNNNIPTSGCRPFYSLSQSNISNVFISSYLVEIY